MNIWFTSDTHYGHKNICRGTSEWEKKEDTGQRTRDFETLEEMNDAIVNGINNYVKEDDILYHLGDWSFGGIQNIWEFRKRINCKNIHLVLGNHDHHIQNNRTLPNVITSVHGDIRDIEEGTSDYDENCKARNLFNSVNQLLIKDIGGVGMTLCHYAFRTWDKAHHGTWMLHGHSHGTLPTYFNTSKWAKDLDDKDVLNEEYYGTDHIANTKYHYKTIDVGIDSAYKLFGEYRPFSLENDLKPMFKDRSNLCEDHHNEKTN